MRKFYFVVVSILLGTISSAQIPTTNLSAWFDAANVVTDGSGNVDSWPDQSSNGFVSTPVLPGATLETITGHDGVDYPFVRFAGTSFLSTGTLASSADGITIFTVLNNATNPANAISLLNATDSLIYPSAGYRAINGAELSTDPFINRSLGNGVTGKDFEVTAFRYQRNKAVSGMSTWRNGIMIAARGTVDLAVPGMDLYIGGYQNPDQSTLATADIAEIIIYYGTLGDADMQTVHSYLLNKYNVVQNQYPFSASEGDWNDPSIWAGNAVPGAADDVIISPKNSGYVLIDGITASCRNLIVLENSGLSVFSDNGQAVLNIGVGSGFNNEFAQKGTVFLDSASLVIHGNWLLAFSQNDTLADGLTIIDATNIVIDGNNGVPAQSVDQTKALIDFQVVNAGFFGHSNRTGFSVMGKADITIVDPHLHTDGITMRNFSSSHYSGFINPNSAKYGNLRLGDGISTQFSNNPNGFVITNFQMPLKVVANSIAANNRMVTDMGDQAYYIGGMKIIAGGLFNSQAGTSSFEYDLDNDGIFNKPIGSMQFSVSDSEIDSISVKGTGNFNTSLTDMYITAPQDLNIRKIGFYVPIQIHGGSFIGPGTHMYLNNQPFIVDQWDKTSENADWFIANPSYFICNGTGRLIHKATIAGDSLFFFVGLPNLFAPLTIINNGIQDDFSVAVKSGITPGSNPPNLVNFEWLINESIAGGSNANMVYQWRKTNELFVPDSTTIRVKHFNTGVTAWENLTTATAYQSRYPGYRKVVATGVTSFSPFSISATNLVLPVNLLTFTGQRVQVAILLNWQTAQEESSLRFDVERSTSGATFSKIGTVAAKGYSSSITDYSFTDAAPLNGVNYYRLKQIDIDEKFVYSKIIPVDFKRNTNIVLSPNPATDYLKIQLPGASQLTSLRVIDASGKMVLQRSVSPLTTTLQLDISQLAKGWYIIQFIGTERVRVEQAFLKQ